MEVNKMGEIIGPDHSHHFTAIHDYPKIMAKRALLKVFIAMQVMLQMCLVFYASMFPSSSGPPSFITALAVLLGLAFSLSGALGLQWYNMEVLKFYGAVAPQGTMFAMVILSSLRSEFKNEQASRGIPLLTSWMEINTVDLYWYIFMLLGAILAVSQALTTHFLVRDLRKVYDLQIGGKEDLNLKKEKSMCA